MSTILPAFLQLGKKTVKDSLKLIRQKEGASIRLERIRMRQGRLFNKFDKYERNYINLNYIDEENKRLGGTVKVYTKEFDFALLKPHYYYQYGYFTLDRLVFAQFNTNTDIFKEGNQEDDLIKPDLTSTNIILRHNYEIVNGLLNYRLEVNPKLVEASYEDLSNYQTTIESELLPRLRESFTERLFYNVSKN